MATCAAAARAAALSSAACRSSALRSQARSQAVRLQAVPARMFFGGLFGGGAKREVGGQRERRRPAGGASGARPVGGMLLHRSHIDAALNPLLQGKNDEVLKAARAAKRGCELAPASAPEGLEIATVAGAAAVCCALHSWHTAKAADVELLAASWVSAALL